MENSALSQSIAYLTASCCKFCADEVPTFYEGTIKFRGIRNIGRTKPLPLESFYMVFEILDGHIGNIATLAVKILVVSMTMTC